MKKMFIYPALLQFICSLSYANPESEFIPRKLDRVEQLFVDSEYELLYSKRELDPIMLKFIPDEIADPGEPYNIACESNGNYPDAGIQLAGSSEQLAFVTYEKSRGFAGSSARLLIFEKEEGKYTSVCDYTGNFYLYISGLAELKELFRQEENIHRKICTSLENK